MGALVLASTLGGLGKGMVDEVNHTREVEKEQRQEEREVRLRQMEIEYQKQAQVDRQNFESSQQQKQFSQQSDLEAKKEAGENSRAQMNRDSIESEGAANRASREKLAGIRAKTAMANKKFQSRWKFQNVPGRQEIIGNQFVEKPPALMLADTMTGQAFSQVGDAFVPQGIDPSTIKRPAKEKEAVQALLENPDRADDFVKKYKYLPAQFIRSMNSQVTTSQSAPAGTQDDEEE